MFLLSKALYPGPAYCDNKSLLKSNTCAVYMLRESFNLPKDYYDRMPPRKSHKRSQGGQFNSWGKGRIRKNIIKYPNTQMCSMLWT